MWVTGVQTCALPIYREGRGEGRRVKGEGGESPELAGARVLTGGGRRQNGLQFVQPGGVEARVLGGDRSGWGGV